jgi:hypothetical protein
MLIARRINKSAPTKCVLLFFLFICSFSGLAQEIQLSSSTSVATAGNFTITWEAQGIAGDFQLEQSLNADFSDARIIYRGPDTASVISGLHNGKYHYRVAAVDGDSNEVSSRSKPLTVTVAHHSLTRAVTFFIVGFFVFIATLVVILRGNR